MVEEDVVVGAEDGGSGGGPPGADAPTHRTNSANRGAYAVSSTASVSSEDVADIKRRRVQLPGVGCEPQALSAGLVHRARGRAEDEGVGDRKPSTPPSQCGARWRVSGWGCIVATASPRETTSTSMPRWRHESRLSPGSVPDEAVYLDSLRRRRDLSVLLLLDVSGSTAEPGTVGRTVHQQQRAAIADLTVALHDLGDRVALYAYYSQGRAAVNMVPVKRFDDHLDARVIRRLNSLEPGAYSRLGAAIRHGSAVLEARGGTSRRLLVVVSDGLAYDHGYERAYGAADARRALTEARRRGTGCVCLTVGAGTDVGVSAEGVRKHCTRDHRPARSTRRHRRPALPFGYSFRGGAAPGFVTPH